MQPVVSIIILKKWRDEFKSFKIIISINSKKKKQISETLSIAAGSVATTFHNRKSAGSTGSEGI